jgi:hypothetical protein
MRQTAGPPSPALSCHPVAACVREIMAECNSLRRRPLAGRCECRLVQKSPRARWPPTACADLLPGTGHRVYLRSWKPRRQQGHRNTKDPRKYRLHGQQRQRSWSPDHDERRRHRPVNLRRRLRATRARRSGEFSVKAADDADGADANAAFEGAHRRFRICGRPSRPGRKSNGSEVGVTSGPVGRSLVSSCASRWHR